MSHDLEQLQGFHIMALVPGALGQELGGSTNLPEEQTTLLAMLP
jgi:hypothetical protein